MLGISTGARRAFRGIAIGGVALTLVTTPSVSASASTPTAAHAAAAAAVSTTGVRIGISSASREYANPTATRITVKAVSASGRVPKGVIHVRENGRTIAVVTPDAAGNGRYDLPKAVSVGFHRYYAVFLPSTAAWRGSTSASINLTVVRTRSFVSLSLDPRFQIGSGGWGTVTVSSHGTTPSGVIVVTSKNKVIYRTSLTRGSARFSISPNTALGRTDLKVTYTGSSTNLAGSAAQAITVLKRRSSISMNSTATLTSVKVNGTLFAPGGQVRIAIDGTTVATRTISGGRTALAYDRLFPGTHTVTVTYLGDSKFNTSSASMQIVVSLPTNNCDASARACVDLTHDLAWLQEGGRIVYGPVPMLSGRPGYRTSTGLFSVYWKDIDHVSSIFNSAPMPYSIFFNGGEAFHEGSLSITSHGCIHLGYSASRYFWDALDYGDSVHVFGYAPY